MTCDSGPTSHEHETETAHEASDCKVTRRHLRRLDCRHQRGGAEILDEYDSTLVEANGLLEKGKLTEAFKTAQAAGKLEPRRFEAPALAAMILHAAGRTNRARQFLAEALKLAPAVPNDELEALRKRLADAPAAQRAETDSPRLLGRWELPGGKEPLVFAKDGKCELPIGGGIIEGTYTIHADSKVTVEAKTKDVRVTLQFYLEGDRLTDGVVFNEQGQRYWSKVPKQKP